MPKTWLEKKHNSKPAHVVVLEKKFAGLPEGKKLLITSPEIIDSYMRRIPKSSHVSFAEMRNDLARSFGADAACPVTSSIHSRILAEIAIEEMAAGALPNSVTPFWRVVDPKCKWAKKLSIGEAGVEQLRADEVKC
jgi:hypothetical protein